MVTRVNVSNGGDKAYTYNVEKDVPIPARKEKKASTTREHKYPFLLMTNGDSFVVPTEAAAKLAQRMGLLKPYEVHTSYREIKDGENAGKFRVWRVQTKAEKLAEKAVA